MNGVGFAALLASASSLSSVFAGSLATPFAIEANIGDRVVVEGSLHSRIDGADFDAAHVRDSYLGKGEPRLRSDGLVDWEQGGLKLVERDWEHHRAVALVVANDAPVCRAAGIDGPCIVPRVDVFARDRLVPSATFLGSLSGGLTVATMRPPPGRAWIKVASVSTAAAIAVLLAWTFASVRRRNEAWRRIAREARLLERQARTLPNGAVVHQRAQEVMKVAKRTIAMLKRIDQEARTAPGRVRVSLEVRRQALLEDLARTTEQLSSVRLRLALGGEGEEVDAALEALVSEVAIGESAMAETNAATSAA